VVITGASSGVGRCAARAFGAQGARVALIARGSEGLAAAAAEIAAAGGEAMVLPLDVADDDAVQSAADRVVATWGTLDVWVNNAMVSVLAPASAMTADEFRRVTEVNYLGTVHGTLAALRHMRPRGQGTILQIGSALAYRSIPLQSAYCASKAAVRGFTDSLRSELLHERSRIRLTMLQLPAVNTPQFTVLRNKVGRQAHPVPPLYQPEVIAAAILRAAASPRRERWLALASVRAILGQQVIPGLLDRYLARAAWERQTTDQPVPGTGDNLLAPLPGDRGAHGPFDDEARTALHRFWGRPPGGVFGVSLALGGVLSLFAASLLRRELA
jgi:NADP-dependent 3-hydroxy acid dehydrogenase YdfG